MWWVCSGRVVQMCSVCISSWCIVYHLVERRWLELMRVILLLRSKDSSITRFVHLYARARIYIRTGHLTVGMASLLTSRLFLVASGSTLISTQMRLSFLSRLDRGVFSSPPFLLVGYFSVAQNCPCVPHPKNLSRSSRCCCVHFRMANNIHQP